ncbi:MAG: OmpA family protein [Acidimicrobiales bacterium]
MEQTRRAQRQFVSLPTVLAVCVGLALASIAAVGLGLFDHLIESFPGRSGPNPPSAAETGAAVDRRVDPALQTSTTVDLEPHRAVYRDGTLTLEGTVPSEEISAAFEAKAAEVIGADNVINNYVIDERAPEPTDGRVIVDEPFLFEFDSARIDDQFTDLLDLGVLVMDLNPQATMRVVGHADATGPDMYNNRLALDRAAAVAAYMTDHGVARRRVEVEGRGERQPIGDNTTSAGRALNRRIEIELLDLLS